MSKGMKFDNGKLRYGLIPPVLLKEVAKVLTFGAKKYEANGWKDIENGDERYLDALYRHLEAYRSGEKFDDESGLSHLSHASTNLAFLLHFEELSSTPPAKYKGGILKDLCVSAK